VALRLGASDVEGQVRALVAGPLGQKSAPWRIHAALVAHLPFVQTRHETVFALAALEDPAAVGPLLGCLESDPYVPVRVAAAEGLGRLGGARAVQGLEAALVREREEAVRAALRAALARRRRAQ
jgi:HEAT repeat protein